ncbi:MAG: adenylate/guanylate cyclase domain-containing protein [Spirochaetales bacterium]|nr:MAG: adenylate/guanylate cyclase domain-containing protein [Spirochaetales bacterium]
MVDTDVSLVLRNVTRISLLITVIAVALSLAASIGMGALFTRGIIRLDRIVRGFDQTNLDVRSDISSRDEVGRLGSSFNEMADTIQNYSVQLESLLNAFKRFVPHEFIQFLDKKSILDVRLGDQVQKKMTIMFSDIRSFSELSESMTPEENFKFLNSYLSRVGPEIRAHGGFIDKYIGDSIMALFPEKPEDALRAAIAMFGKLIEYNGHRQSTGYIPIGIGIGLHTGSLMLGTLGEHERMDGSVISDAVNLCSRLESLTRMYGASILLSGVTLDLLPDKNSYGCRFVDKVQVKGRKEPTTIYEVFDTDPADMVIRKRDSLQDWNGAVKSYFYRRFREAFKILYELKKNNPDDVLYDIFLRRCVRHIKTGVPDDWQGVEVLQSK